MAEQITLSISLLASNRPDSIRRCLDSLKPIMEQIPSELILVDTSGSESLHQILLEYTDHVVRFDWCNDFSKARNAGLELAKGEWFLFLDDDEWFVDIDPLVHFFQSGEYRNYTCANYIVRNFYDRAYQNYSDSWVSRMVKIVPGTRFRSKIHEYLYPAGTKCKPLSAMAYHSGYIYDTEEDRRKHFERNASLLLDMIKEEPEQLRWKVQLAQEYRSIKDWRALYKYCVQALEETRHLDSKYDNYDIGTFYAGEMESLLFLERYDEAIMVGEQALADKRNSLLCFAYIYLCFAVVYLSTKEYEKAEDYVHKYLRAGKQLRKEPIELEEQTTALLVGEALDSVPMKRAYSVLIACGLHRGDVSPLQKYLKDLEWDKKVIYVFDGMVDIIVDAVANSSGQEVLVEASRLLWNNRETQAKYFARVQDWVDKPLEFQRLLSVIAELESDHWYVYYARVRVADWETDADKIPNCLEELFSYSPNVFMIPDEIVDIANKYKVDLEELYLSIEYDQWKQQLEEYISKVTLEDLLITEQEFRMRKTKESPYYEFLFLQIAEAKAISIGTQSSMDTKRRWLEEFARSAADMCAAYYQSVVVENYPEILPEDLQAGIWVSKGLKLQQTELPQALKLYKTAIEACPSFGDALKNYVHMLKEERRQKEQARREELYQLQIQIKGEAEKALDQGKPAAAYNILKELQKMKPNDLEIVTLILKARIGMLEESAQ